MIYSPYIFPGLNNIYEILASRREENPELVLRKIIDATLKLYNLPAEMVFRKRRKREVVLCRQVMHYLAYKYTDISLVKLGALLHHGKAFDHSSLIHSIRQISNQMEYDDQLSAQVESLECMLRQDEYRIRRNTALAKVVREKIKKKQHKVMEPVKADPVPFVRSTFQAEHERVIEKYAI